MNCVIVASHGGLAQALVATVEAIAGAQPNVLAVALPPGGTPEAFARELARAAGAYSPVLILCDLRHGTPHHAALRLAAERADARVLTGANLAMVLEAALSLDAAGIGTVDIDAVDIDAVDIDALAARAQTAALVDIDPDLARQNGALL